jgi:hypothetical protein
MFGNILDWQLRQTGFPALIALFTVAVDSLAMLIVWAVWRLAIVRAQNYLVENFRVNPTRAWLITFILLLANIIVSVLIVAFIHLMFNNVIAPIRLDTHPGFFLFEPYSYYSYTHHSPHLPNAILLGSAPGNQPFIVLGVFSRWWEVVLPLPTFAFFSSPTTVLINCVLFECAMLLTWAVWAKLIFPQLVLPALQRRGRPVESKLPPYRLPVPFFLFIVGLFIYFTGLTALGNMPLIETPGMFGTQMPILPPWLQNWGLGGVVILTPLGFLARRSIITPPARRLAEKVRQQQTEQDQGRTLAMRRVKQAQPPEAYSTAEGNAAVWGAITGGTLGWNINGWLAVLDREFSKHGVVVGASGSGKTVSLLRIAYLAARIYGYKIYFIDAKGDQQTATQFIAMMNAAQVGQVRMFPGESMNGFKGDGNAILNRLMAVETYSEAYYKAIAKRLLTLACRAPGGAPTDSNELLKRLNTDLLKQIYGASQERTELEEMSGKDAAGVRNRYRSFFGSIEGKLDNGWSWEDADAGYVLLDGLALREEAASLGRYLIEDFAHFCSKRKAPDQKVLLIIDEYSALSTSETNAANLFERLRSYNACIIVSSQSVAGLGTPQEADRIISAANWLLVHRSSDPEQLTARAGTQKETDESYKLGGAPQQQAYEQGQIRIQETPLVHPDIARRLEVGEALLIAHGRYQQIMIAPAPTISNQDKTSLPAIQTNTTQDNQNQDAFSVPQRTSSPASVTQLQAKENPTELEPEISSQDKGPELL